MTGERTTLPERTARGRLIAVLRAEHADAYPQSWTRSLRGVCAVSS